jgi:aspartyl-tRNA(Asn)/glutamyl-tRNA(Gln) amidotransferase subunit C
MGRTILAGQPVVVLAGPLLESPPVIGRDQVSRVARLAALKLDEDEIERMRTDLGEILDHVEQISELDLAGVEPTSHVVDLMNVLRPDLPRPSSPREKMLDCAPEPFDDSFRVPSTQAEP